MKSQYRRPCFYFDDGILIGGYKDKYGFHPDKMVACGFDIQKIRKKNIGKTLFFDPVDAVKEEQSVRLNGGRANFSVDDGMAQTKVYFSFGSGRLYYIAPPLKEKDHKELKKLFKDCLKSVCLIPEDHFTALYSLTSEYMTAIPRNIEPTTHNLDVGDKSQ